MLKRAHAYSVSKSYFDIEEKNIYTGVIVDVVMNIKHVGVFCLFVLLVFVDL